MMRMVFSPVAHCVTIAVVRPMRLRPRQLVPVVAMLLVVVVAVHVHQHFRRGHQLALEDDVAAAHQSARSTRSVFGSRLIVVTVMKKKCEYISKEKKKGILAQHELSTQTLVETMFSRALLNRAAPRVHASATKGVRRMYSIEESSMHVKRAAKPPIFEDVVPTKPATSLRRRRDSNNTVSTLSSLDKPMPHLPQVVELEPTSFAHTVTTLSNGVRVISQQTVDTGAVVGIALDAGTRHEREAERGSTLLAERLAFKVRLTLATYSLVHLTGFCLPFAVAQDRRGGAEAARARLDVFAVLHARRARLDGRVSAGPSRFRRSALSPSRCSSRTLTPTP
jgi:hypothetical protein